jgi:hypothetical protein
MGKNVLRQFTIVAASRFDAVEWGLRQLKHKLSVSAPGWSAVTSWDIEDATRTGDIITLKVKDEKITILSKLADGEALPPALRVLRCGKEEEIGSVWMMANAV